MLETFLRDEYTYAFATAEAGQPPPGADPVEWFLFESKEGTAGQFSSAFVVLARAVDIPARVVSSWSVGSGGETCTVFPNEAHQWAEVAFQDLGWVTFEPTASGGAPSRSAIPERRSVRRGTPAEVRHPRYPGHGDRDYRLAGRDPVGLAHIGRRDRNRVRRSAGRGYVEVFVNKKKENGGLKVGSAVTRQGRFSLALEMPASVARGSYQLIAHAMAAPGYAESWSDPEILVYSGTGLEFSGPVRMPVEEAAEFRGRLSEETRGALAGQEVSIAVDGNPYAPVTTDERGDFSFEVSFDEPGDHSIKVELAPTDFLLGNTVNLDVTATMPSTLVIEMPLKARTGATLPVSSVLKDHRGNPLTGQTVELTVSGESPRAVVTDAESGFTWETVFDTDTETTVKVEFEGNNELDPFQTLWPVTVAAPEIVVGSPAPVARGDTLTLRWVVVLGSRAATNVDLDVAVERGGEQAGETLAATTNGAGAFVLRCPIPTDADLSDMALELSALALETATTVTVPVRSTTSIIVVPLERVRPGRPALLEARLLDDRGAGIPNAALHYGQDAPVNTGPGGVAMLTVSVPDEDGLLAVPLTFRFEGDESNLPLTYFVGVPVSTGGFGWLLWAGLAAAAVIASGGTCLDGRRGLAAPVLSRRGAVARPPAPTAPAPTMPAGEGDGPFLPG